MPVGMPFFSICASSASTTVPRLHSSMNEASSGFVFAAKAAMGCSAATAQKVVPISVSARVVNTQSVFFSLFSSYGKPMRTPSDLPIQFFCISLTCSGQPSMPSSAPSSSSAYFVMRKKYIGISRFSTGAPVRQPLPSITCSLASTVWSTGSQLTTPVFL